MVLDLWSRVWLTPPAGRKMWAVALTHFSFLSVTWWVNSPCARASDSSLRKSSGRHGDKKKGSLHPQHSTTTGEPQWEQNPGLWQLRHAVISYDQLWQKKPRNLAEPLIARNSTTKTWTLIETVFRLPTKNAKPAVQKTRSERFATTKKKHQPNSGLPSMAGAWPAKQNAKNGGIKIMNTPRNACLKTLFAYKCCRQGSSKLSQTKSHIFVPLQHPNSKKNSWWKSHASNCICRPSTSCQFHAICRSSNLKIMFPISEFVLQPPKRPLGLGHAAPWQNHLKARNKAMKGDSMGQHPPDIGHNRHAAQCSSWTQQGLMSPVIFVNQLALVLQSPNL